MKLAEATAAQWVLIAVALLVGFAGVGLIARNLAAILKLKRLRSHRRALIGRAPQISRRAFFRKSMLLPDRRLRPRTEDMCTLKTCLGPQELGLARRGLRL